MKKTKLLTSLVALTYVLALGACESTTTEPEQEPDVEEKDHTITFEGNEFVHVFELPEEADTGDEIYFKLLTESGYSIPEVSVFFKTTEWIEVEVEPDSEESINPDDLGDDDDDDDDDEEEEEPETVWEEIEVENPIEFEGDLTTGFTFTMPDEDVIVRAPALGAYFKLWYDADTIVQTDYNGQDRKQSAFWHGAYEPYTGAALGTGTTNYIQAGTELLIVAERTYTSGDNVQLYANGEPLVLVTDAEISANLFAFSLTMPAYDCEITASAGLDYATVTLDTADLVDENGDPLIDAYLYTEDEPETHLTSLDGQKIAGDKVYIYAKPYSDNYTMTDVTLAWNSYSSISSTETKENTKTTTWISTTSSTDTGGTAARVDKDTRIFQIPSAYYSDGNIVVSFTIEDVGGEYSGYGFVGQWVGYEFYSGAKSGSLCLTNLFPNGNLVSSTSYLNGSTIVSVAEDNLTVTFDQGNRVFYNNGTVGTMYWSSSGSSTADVWILAKDVADFTMDIWKSSSTIYAIRLLVDDECIGAIYNNNNDTVKFHAGVEIEFAEGYTTLAQSGSKFTIKDASGNELYNNLS